MGRGEGGTGRGVSSILRRAPYDRFLEGSINNVERMIANMPYENAIALNMSGQLMLEKVGTENRVEFNQTEVNALKDTVFMHNHPPPEADLDIDGGSFSSDDLNLAYVADVQEIRAVSKDYTYSLMRPAGGWPANNVLFEEHRSLFESFFESLMAGFDVRFEKGENFTKEEVYGDIFDGTHSIMADLATKHGVAYTRTRR